MLKIKDYNLRYTTSNAFTLAEVLVTLTIIGIIATLTIPALITDLQRSDFVVGLRRAYYEFAHASNEIRYDNGGTLESLFTDSNTMMNSFCTYVSCVKQCNLGQNPGDCWHNTTAGWKDLSGANGWFDAGTTTASAVTGNGQLASFEFVSSDCTDNRHSIYGLPALCGFLHVDVNGFKGPNQAGRDIFTFNVTKQGTFPHGTIDSDHSISTNMDFCDPTKTIFSGVSCAARVLREGTLSY